MATRKDVMKTVTFEKRGSLVGSRTGESRLSAFGP